MIDPISAFAGNASTNGSIIAATPANAELNAAILENQRWLAQFEFDEFDGTRTQSAPNEMPRIGIQGAGFFALDDNGIRVFARATRPHVDKDGRLLDDRGRSIMGFACGVDHTPECKGGLTALRVPLRDISLYKNYEIALDGGLWGTLKPASHKRKADTKVELGQLAIAIFPNPQTLEANEHGVLAATPVSGKPHYVPAGAPNVGPLRHNPPNPSREELLSNLRALWAQSGRAEIEIALAASKDSLARIALNLVR